jgi:hypothetical protein
MAGSTLALVGGQRFTEALAGALFVAIGFGFGNQQVFTGSFA